MSKASTKKALQTAIDQEYNVCKNRIWELQLQKDNPNAALMIEKNRGYMLALEDVTTLLYSNKVY